MRPFILATITTLLVAGTSAMAQEANNIQKLWKQYEKAFNEDQPQKAIDILTQIKKEALDKGLAWDYYHAGEEYLDRVSSKDWRKRAELNKQFVQECKDFPAPINEFCRKYEDWEDTYSVFTSNEEKLRLGHNPRFYQLLQERNQTYNSKIRPFLVKNISNDLEFALWAMALSHDQNHSGSILTELAESYASDKYKAAILEYFKCRKNELEAFAKKHNTEAVAMLAEDDLLYNKLEKLQKNQASSEDFKALRADCRDFLKRRSALFGKDRDLADCCKRVDQVIELLDEKTLDCNIKDGVMTAVMKNVNSAEMDVSKDGKKVFSTIVQARPGHYFVPDTVSKQMQNLNDGEYEFAYKGSNIVGKKVLYKYGLSAASTVIDGKEHIYIADSQSGEPCQKVDVVLLHKGKEAGRANGLQLNGFTPVPESLLKNFSKSSDFQLQCITSRPDGTQKMSKPLYVTNDREISSDSSVEHYICRVLTDSRAFHPDDLVHCKVILFKEGPGKNEACPCKGSTVKLVLKNPSWESVVTQMVTLNDFGSAYTSFQLEKEWEHGEFTIEALVDGKEVAYCPFISDEFVLPHFYTQFEKQDRLLFAGEDFPVKGRVISYSGQSLSECKATYCINDNYSPENEKPLEIHDDGSFQITVKTEKARKYLDHYNVKVRITDATGETHEFFHWLMVNPELSIQPVLTNAVAGQYRLAGKDYNEEEGILKEKIANIDINYSCQCKDAERVRIRWELLKKGKVIKTWNSKGDKGQQIDFSDMAEGLYEVKIVASITDSKAVLHEDKKQLHILWCGKNGKTLSSGLDNFFIPDDSEGSILMGSGTGPLWAVADVFDADGKLIEEKLIHLEGEKQPVKKITFESRNNWTTEVDVRIFYFRQGRAYEYSHDFDKCSISRDIPLNFIFETTKFRPGTEYNLTLKTVPDSECSVTIFDQSSEQILSNNWRRMDLYTREVLPQPLSIETGLFQTEWVRYRTKAAGILADVNSKQALELYVEEESVSLSENGNDEAHPANIREDFSAILAFEPFLRTGADGTAKMDFKTSDKLSTFVVQAFVHDKKMNNAVKREEILVTLPVQLSMVEPLYFYCGDECEIKALLSNKTDEDISGTLEFMLFDGADRASAKVLERQEQFISTKSHKASPAFFRITAPKMKEGAKMGLLLSFTPGQKGSKNNASDAIFTVIPVKHPVQTISEAHSAVFHPGDKLEELCDSLRSAFVNMSGIGAERNERKIIDMVEDALDSKISTGGQNALSLTETLYAELLKGSLTDRQFDADSLCNLILKCKCDDGGFAWFAGMKASPMVTAVVLDRIAAMKKRNVLPECLELASVPAVEYLDKMTFSTESEPYYLGWISLEQYLSVRSLYPGVEIKYDIPEKVRKNATAYLVPGKVRGLNGQILSNCRRIATLYNLATSQEGNRLAKALGVKLATERRLKESMSKSIESLLQYSVRHSSGGANFPNAVMLFRGLLENEAYAHSYIANLLRKYCEAYPSKSELAPRCKALADEVCLWLMIQKETQNWDGEPLCIEAIASMLESSDHILNTSVASLSKTVEKGFDELASAGNGMSIERNYYLGNVDDEHLVHEGDSLKVGDKLIAVYKVNNDENRSFVLLKAWYPACLRPVNQLSGISIWSSLARSSSGRIQPLSYREVKTGCSEYWFDCYPEGKSEILEEFFVTQAGVFQSPVLEIESTYARHYRANSVSDGKMVSK